MGWVESKVEDVGDFFQDEVIDPISDLGSEIDDFVNEEVPGGWYTVAAATILGPELLAEEALATEAAAAGDILGTAEEIGSVIDSAYGTAGGVYGGDVEAQLGGYYGEPGIPAYEPTSGAMGSMSEQEVGTIDSGGYYGDMGGVYGGDVEAQPGGFYGQSPSISLKNVFDSARLANQLFGSQPSQMPQIGQPGQAGKGAGVVDYNELLSLLSRQAQQPGLLGTQFQPQGTNIADFINAQRISSLLG